MKYVQPIFEFLAVLVLKHRNEVNMRKTNSHARKATTILFRQTDRIRFPSITERFLLAWPAHSVLHYIYYNFLVLLRKRDVCDSLANLAWRLISIFFLKWPGGGGWWGIEKLQKICYVIREAETVKIKEINNYLRDLGFVVHVDDVKRISSLS